jgi:hypothetical protein
MLVMSFLRVKTIKGRRYLYRQTSVRKGKKVTTISEYLGAIGSVLRGGGETEEAKKRREYQEYYNRSLRSAAREDARFEEWQRKTYGETGAERAKREAEEAKFSQEKFLNETAKPNEEFNEARAAEKGEPT